MDAGLPRRLVHGSIAALGVAVAVLFAVPTSAQAQEQCHPSYVGECVPIASDADCAGGSGNGPVHVRVQCEW